jgi:hypothetical protein
MPESLKYIIDAAVGGLLFVALLIVFTLDFFFFSGSSAPAKNTLPNVKEYGGEKKQTKKLKLAVTPSSGFKQAGKVELWDDMGKLLDGLGEGFRYEPLAISELVRRSEAGTLNEYDVIFLTCSSARDEDQLREPLMKYVSNGGILYASDWRYDAIARAFPDVVVPQLRGDGAAGIVHADVMDSALKEVLASDKIELKFDLGEWKPAAFGGPRVKTLLQGKYKLEKKNAEVTAPLMVKFEMNKGVVIFTSFHNEKQNSRTEKQLLEYLVFSLVTAGVDAEVNASMSENKFTPRRSTPLSAPGKDEVKKTYENEHVCNLRFVLGFRSEGVKLRFNIKSPDGLQYTKDCESTTVLEVTSAAKGTWTYSVTALEAYANFPFTLTVGEKK